LPDLISYVTAEEAASLDTAVARLGARTGIQVVLGIFTVVGIAMPGVGWFIYVFMIPFWAIFPIIIVGSQPTLYLLATYLVGYPVAKLYLGRQEWYKKAARELKTSGRTSFGGFVMTSGGGSSGSSWSSGGGDSFSGGGGDSGGGGASGSW
jgi:uncharacterized protein